MKKLPVGVLLLTILMAACSSEPPKPAEKPQPKETEALTGRSAFQKLYVAAHGWGGAVQPYRLESQVTSDSSGKDGKSAIWRAGFASAAQRGVKPYVWSGSIAPDAPSRGINPGTEDNYNPTNASTQVFDIAFLKVDSDKAYEVALKHGGDKIMEKDAASPVTYLLDWNRSDNQLVWHVSFGNKLKVALDASSGEFLRAEK